MAGLRRICKAFGGMRTGNVEWLWDYHADEPVKAKEMPVGSERWKASEKARHLSAGSRPERMDQPTEDASLDSTRDR